MRLYQSRVKSNVNQETRTNEPKTEELDFIRQQIYTKLLSIPGLLTERKETDEGKIEIRKIISQTFRNANIDFQIKRNAEHHIEQIYNDLCGYGPIQVLLNDPSITEIKVNGPKIIRIEDSSGVEKQVEGLEFRDKEHLYDVINRIVRPIGRKIDLSNPICDAFFPDKSRVNVVIDPIAFTGPYLTIRKFVPQLTIDELCRRGAFKQDIIPVLKVSAEAALSAVVSGGTGGGKTTLLNAIAGFIPPHQSIITIEDVLELDLHHPDVRSLVTRPPNIEGKGEITTKQLLISALRMKPKRIIVGEVRDEAIDEALTAMNTGHEGSGFSIHANNPQELPERVEYLSPKPRESILTRFGKSVHMIYQVNQLDDGRRRMTHIAQVGGYDTEKGQVIIENLFEFDYDQDCLVRTNVPFRFEKKLRDKKIPIPEILLQTGSR